MKQYLEKRGIYITWSQLVMRIIFDLVGFLLALLPAGLTLYLTDVWITSGTHSLINHLLKLKEKKLILVISHNAYYDAVADRTYEIRKGIMHQVQSH